MSPEGELWQQCVEWIKSAGVLPQGQQNFAKLSDFAAILRNGVLLCELAMRIAPDCIDRHEIVAKHQQSPFICSKNISLFLNACRNSFGIRELFSEEDLFELQNFAGVLRLLSQLSRTQKSRQLGIKPFPEETFLPSELSPEENIYSNLREEVEQCSEVAIAQYSELNKTEERTGREIYDSICAQKIPRSKSIPIAYSEFKPVGYRQNCLKELLDTEINYVDFLQKIVDLLLNRLRHHLSAEDLDIIFINIERILLVNQDFLGKLKPAIMKALNIEVSSWACNSTEASTITDVFLSLKMSFTAYALYCSRIHPAVSRIDELERSDEKFKRIIEEFKRVNAEQSNDDKFKHQKLQDQIVMPFQRIAKYPLFLDNLIKDSQDEVEKESLGKALDAMKEVMNYVNEMKRDQETIELICTIKRSIYNLQVDLLDFGRFLCDNSVKVEIHDVDSKKTKQRYVFLFEKLLLLCKQETRMYKPEKLFLLCEFELIENDNELAPTKYNTISRKLTNSMFDSLSLSIVKRKGMNGSPPPIIVKLIFKSMAERDKWKQLVRKAIELNNPRAAIAKGHALLYKSYKKLTVCSFCYKFLNGAFFQGYHCSGCNRDLHVDCAHLKECVTRRSIELEGSNNNWTATRIRTGQLFFPGEVAVITQLLPANDQSTLSCQSGDFVELIEVNNEQRTALCRLGHQPQTTGQISLDCLAKTVESLERRRRSSRLDEVIHTHSSLLQSQTQRRSNLVSSFIIKLYENVRESDKSDAEGQPWYFGEINRDVARSYLENSEDGTFLVRWNGDKQHFAISLRFSGTVKNIKVEYSQEDRKYFLYDGKFFDSIKELVNYYRNNSLSEGFALDAMLKGTPLKGNVYMAIGNYVHHDASTRYRYLTLNKGDIIHILDTSIADYKGWWKGNLNGKIGFFPISFVKECHQLSCESSSASGANDNLLDIGNGNGNGGNGHIQQQERRISSTHQQQQEFAEELGEENGNC